ncbi:MAG: hypothetical protein WBO17_00700 [Sphingorhabdus sp.]
MIIDEPKDMRSFVLHHNIKHLTRFLDTTSSADDLEYIRNLIRDDKKELAVLNASENGAFSAGNHFSRSAGQGETREPLEIEFDEGSASGPCLIVDPGPGLYIVEANDACKSQLGLARSRLVGSPFYDVFQENAGSADSEYISNTLASFHKVVEEKGANTIPAQRIDILDASGSYQRRDWKIENRPVFDANGDVSLIIHQLQEITHLQAM